MSMFQMLFPPSQTIALAMNLIHIHPNDFPRFRDAWIERGPAGEPRVAVYCRMGGNNKKHYSSEDQPEGETCACTACTLAFIMREHPLFTESIDDSYDNTYTTVYFAFPFDEQDIPEDLRSEFNELILKEPRSVSDEWKYKIEHMDETLSKLL